MYGLWEVQFRVNPEIYFLGSDLTTILNGLKDIYSKFKTCKIKIFKGTRLQSLTFIFNTILLKV